MQHTTKYQLNLIETSDPFSPAPLNENAQKVEAAIAAETAAEAAARAAETAALDQRVQVLELHHFIAGTYTGNGEQKQFIPLPFTPAAVLLDIVNGNDPRSTLAVTGFPTYTLEIVSGGFKVSNYNYDSANGGKHCYIAFC